MAKNHEIKRPVMTKKNIRFVKLEQDEYGYEVVDSSDYEVQNLGDFLCEEIGSDSKLMLNLVDWESEDYLSHGNMTYFGVRDKKVVIGDLFAHMGDDPPCEVELQKDQFWKAIHQWKKLYKEKPDEIIITLDNEGNIELKGVNKSSV